MKRGFPTCFWHIFRVVGLICWLGSWITGCASSATKASVDILNKMEVTYARVTKVVPFAPAEIDKVCEKDGKGSPRVSAICANRNDYELARVAYMHIDTHFVQGSAVVPKRDQVQEQYILELNPPQGLARYKRIAARTETETCKWLGPTPEFLNGGTGIATGFIAGMLIVPGIVILSTDAWGGGVECEGWSYKTVVDEARKR